MFNLEDIEVSFLSTDKKSVEKPNCYIKPKFKTQDLNLLFKQANQYKLLSVEDEKYHLFKIKSNHADAKKSFEVLFNHNLKLVFSVARYYENKGIDLHDLVQEGCLGLIEAIGKFKLDKNVRFSTYATNWIRQKINKNIQEHSRTIRIPSSLNQLVSKYHKYHRFLSNAFNRQPTIEEIAVCMGMPINQVKEQLSNIPQVFSFDASISDEEQSFKDLIGVSKEIEDIDIDNQIGSLWQELKKLDPVNQFIICSLYGSFGHPLLTFKEIATKLNTTTREIKSRYNRALKQLKESLQP